MSPSVGGDLYPGWVGINLAPTLKQEKRFSNGTIFGNCFTGAYAMYLRKQAYSGVRWTTISSLSRGFLQLLQVAILARILSPSDFGVMAVVMAITLISQSFSDMGLSSAIIHFKEINRRQLSSLYWVNVRVTVGMALVLIVAGPFIAELYGDSRLVSLVPFCGATLVVLSIGQQLRTIAEKNLKFASLARVEIIAGLISMLVCVAIALSGGGVYSLVLGVLSNAIAVTGMLWIFFSKGCRPMMYFNPIEIRKFILFGTYVIGNNIASTINNQMDVLLGGRILGSQAIGFYSLPRDFCLRIVSIINPIVIRVGFPVMAKLQDDMEMLKNIYLKTIRMTASVSFPFYIAIAFFSPEVVSIMFGPKWDKVIPLLRIFSIWAMLRSTVNPVGILLLARGKPDLSFRWNISLLLILPIVFWIASNSGIVALAWSLLFSMILLLPCAWFFLVRPLCKAGFIEYFNQLLVPMIVATVSGIAGYASSLVFGNAYVKLSLGVLIGGAAYLALSMHFNRPWFCSMMELISGKR